MILNRQQSIRVPVGELNGFLRRVQRALGVSNREVTVCLVDDAEMRGLNRSYRGRNKTTDVLSFPAESDSGKNSSRRTKARISSASYLGDIAISAEEARRNARPNGRTMVEELRILVLHGVLHLLGYDHERDNGRMNRLEHRLRRRFGLE